MPLSHLMNPAEPDHQEARAQPFMPPPQPFSTSTHNSSRPSIPPIGSSRAHSAPSPFQTLQPLVHPALPQSNSLQLVPLSALTATSNGNAGTYASFPSAYQTSRPEMKSFGNGQRYQAPYQIESPTTRGSFSEPYGQDGLNNIYGTHCGGPMAPPSLINNFSNRGWKDPISSSSSATSSSKSTSTSPQLGHWGGQLSPRRSSENVNGRMYATSVDYIFPNDDVGESYWTYSMGRHTGSR